MVTKKQEMRWLGIWKQIIELALRYGDHVANAVTGAERLVTAMRQARALALQRPAEEDKDVVEDDAHEPHEEEEKEKEEITRKFTEVLLERWNDDELCAVSEMQLADKFAAVSPMDSMDLSASIS